MPGAVMSYQDIYDIGRATLQMRRPRMVVRDGDVSDAILSGGAAMANSIIGAGARGFRSTLLFGATGDDLHVVSHDRGVDWDPGDNAVVTVLFSRLSGGTSGTIPVGTRVATDPDPVTGAFPTFTTNVDVVFLSADLSKSVIATCTDIDRIGNVGIGEITRILDTIPLSGISATNPDRGAGGSPAESDSDLQARTAAFPLVLRRGTEDALIFGAKTTPGVKRVSVVRSGSGIVTMYVSDAFGNSNEALAAAARRVINSPPAWSSAGDVVLVVAATLLLQDVTYTLTVRSGVDIDSLLGRTDAAIVGSLLRLQPGEQLYRTKLSTAVENVDSRSIVSCAINIPAADIVPTASQIIRAGTVSHS